MLDPRVVASREPVGAELPHDVAEERLELYVVVARDAGVRRLADRIRAHETIDDVSSEDFRVIESVEGDPEHPRRTSRVLTRLVRATAPRRIGVASGWHETHPHADDVF